jgi:membrane associated rhomboid family serine protease
MYVTECPYCGQRVRKRAPKIDRDGEAEPRRRRRGPSLSRLRRDEIPGLAPEVRPYATIVLIALALGSSLARVGGVSLPDVGAILGPIGSEWWRLITYAFVHTNLGALIATLVTTGLFGMLLERRFGPGWVLGIFLVGATAGGALTVGLDVYPAIGANGAALALLGAWVVDDRLAARRGDDRENDLIGVAVFAAVLLLLPLADEDTSWAAGAGGLAAGVAIGALMSPLKR